MSVKDTVRDLLDRLPDDCTLDDVLYHLYVIESIERGEADVVTRGTSVQEDMIEELRYCYLPVPVSHLQIIEERLAEHRRDPSRARPAFEVLDELGRQRH